MVDLVAKFPHAKSEVLHEKWGAPVALPAGPLPDSSAGSSAVVALSLYEVNAAGVVVEPLAVLREKGMDIGSFVAKKGTTTVFQIKATVDKKVKLESGDVSAAIEVGTFVDDWVLADPKAQVEKHAGWPGNRVAVSDVAKLTFMKGKVLDAVHSLAITLDTHCTTSSAVDIFMKPTRRVIVARAIAVGGLVLSPDSCNVKVLDEGSTTDGPSHVEITLNPRPFQDKLFVIMPSTSTEAVSPLWFVGTTSDEAAANMTWGKFAVQSLVGMGFIGRPKPAASISSKVPCRAKTGDKPLADVEDKGLSMIVTIPVLVNSKRSQKGDELLVYKAPAAKRPRAVEAISVCKVAKRALAGSP